MQRLKKENEALRQDAERFKKRLRQREEEMRSDSPSWLNQVEDFRQRMTEEWQRHARAHGNPYFGEWLEHARRETEEVAEKLRKKYEKARHQGTHQRFCFVIKSPPLHGKLGPHWDLNLLGIRTA
eukprot:symbB.v1.2.018996.t1/scaffold1501.1/size122984/8